MNAYDALKIVGVLAFLWLSFVLWGLCAIGKNDEDT